MNIFKKNITLIADVFAKLRTPKNVVRLMFKKSVFRGPFDKQHGKWDQTLLKPQGQNLERIYWSLWRQLNWKKSLLVIYKGLRFSFSTLTTGDRYSLLNRENLAQPIQLQLSLKQKTFSKVLSAFSKFRLKSEYFQKEDDTECWCISEITNSERRD